MFGGYFFFLKKGPIHNHRGASTQTRSQGEWMVKLLLQSIAIAPTNTTSRFCSWFISPSSKRCRSISTITPTLAKARKIKSASAQMSSTDQFTFGPYKIDSKEVFYNTPLSYAMVNLRPLLPGTSFLSDFNLLSYAHTIWLIYWFNER